MTVSKYCSDCGAPLVGSGRFCAECGARVELPDAPDEPAREKVPPTHEVRHVDRQPEPLPEPLSDRELWLVFDDGEWDWRPGTLPTQVPSAALRRLAVDDEVEIREKVAHNTATPPDVLRSLAADPYWAARAWVAGNASVPIDLLPASAADPDWFVRAMVGSNRATPTHVLEALAVDQVDGVRKWVAGNPAVPPAVLTRLCADTDAEVRAAAARNPSTPASLPALELRAADRDVYTGQDVYLVNRDWTSVLIASRAACTRMGVKWDESETGDRLMVWGKFWRHNAAAIAVEGNNVSPGQSAFLLVKKTSHFGPGTAGLKGAFLAALRTELLALEQ